MSFFFFKQKTADEMRISDWSSDVCSSDLFDYETSSRKQLKGNIYLAKITRVEPSLQAAFVEYGGNRHGFLPFSEIHPDYYRIPIADRDALLAEEAALKSEPADDVGYDRSEAHTSELQSLMSTSLSVFCLKKNKTLQQLR